MPNEFHSNGGHLAFIGKMRQVRKIWFNIPLEYNTPDSEQEEPALVLSFSIFIGYRPSSDSGDDDDYVPGDQDVADAELNGEEDDDDLSDLPLSAFRLLPDEDDEHGEKAELEFALWNYFEQLEEYRNYLRQELKERVRLDSAFSLTVIRLNYLFWLVAGASHLALEDRHPSLKQANYDDVVRVVLGDPRKDEEELSGQMRSFLMIDSWTVLRSLPSITEEEVAVWASHTPSADVPGEQRQSKEIMDLLVAQICSWRASGGNTFGDDDSWEPHRITPLEVFRLDVFREAIWLDRATIDPMKHFRMLVELLIRSVQNWIHAYTPGYYGNQTMELAIAQAMRNLIAYARTIKARKFQAMLQRDPLSRISQEYKLLEKSWAIGKLLITKASPHRYLKSVMSLYIYLRQHSSIAQIEPMEYLQQLLVATNGNPDVLQFPQNPRLDPDTSSIEEWVDGKQEHIEMKFMALDSFTIERMAFATLQKLHRSCQMVLQPYMRRRQPDSVRAPSFSGLVSCFIEAWQAGSPETVNFLAIRGRRALQFGQDTISHINPKMTFLR
ncbi:hypothetical protein B0H11DRAFT_1347620 [Mycena galericulata]|nr:hypothetical protein B0H11DRAFT_1347620 [Mycena galericulata]